MPGGLGAQSWRLGSDGRSTRGLRPHTLFEPDHIQGRWREGSSMRGRIKPPPEASKKSSLSRSLVLVCALSLGVRVTSFTKSRRPRKMSPQHIEPLGRTRSHFIAATPSCNALFKTAKWTLATSSSATSATPRPGSAARTAPGSRPSRLIAPRRRRPLSRSANRTSSCGSGTVCAIRASSRSCKRRRAR